MSRCVCVCVYVERESGGEGTQSPAHKHTYGLFGRSSAYFIYHTQKIFFYGGICDYRVLCFGVACDG